MPLTATQTLGRLERVAAFRPGVWNGKDYSPEFVRQLYVNFQLFSSGNDPWYSPYVSINHDDELRCGRVYAAELDKSGILYLSCDRLLPDVTDWLKTHRLDERSIEFWLPERRNGRWLGFTDQKGATVPTPVIKCLTLLGADAPAVKGLGPIPQVTFRHRGGKVERFSTRAFAMNQELVNKLTSLGYDVSKLPPDASDDLLQSIIDCIQKIMANPAPAANVVPNADMNPTPTPAAVPAGVTGAAATVNPPAAAQDLQSITLKFRQDIGAVVADVNKTLNQIRAESAALARQTSDRLNGEKEGVIARFFDEMGKTGQVSPAMQPAIKRSLMKCDHVRVAKFSAKLTDGREQGTELDAAMDEIRANYPKLRANGGNPTAPPVAGNHNRGTDATAGGNANGVRSDVVNDILRGTDQGRIILARQTAAK